MIGVITIVRKRRWIILGNVGDLSCTFLSIVATTTICNTLSSPIRRSLVFDFSYHTIEMWECEELLRGTCDVLKDTNKWVTKEELYRHGVRTAQCGYRKTTDRTAWHHFSGIIKNPIVSYGVTPCMT